MGKKYDFILPMGPYHPSLHEPEYFKLYVKGEEIVDVDVYFGYNHRGMEYAMEKDWKRNFFRPRGCAASAPSITPRPILRPWRP